MASTTVVPRRWYHHVTLDLLVLVLLRSVFHPFIAWLVPLCLRAVSMPTTAVEFRGACAYATLVTAAWILFALNQRAAYGRPRTLEWDDEVVLVTGGARGLGAIIAQTYAMRGASVAVLDILDPKAVATEGAQEEERENLKYYQCDIGDAKTVERVRDQVQKDLGPVTILINNAGVVSGERLWDLSTAQIQRNFNVNLLSHYYTIRAFLPGMLASASGGTIVTVSPVLGKLGASHLSDYTAAKAGLIAMHASLRAELALPTAPEGASGIRTILVTPGQLSTVMFAGVVTPSGFLAPVVEPVDLAKAIVRKIDDGESGEISLPLYAQHMDWLNVLPAWLQMVVRYLSGVDSAMAKAHGREKKVL